MLQNYSASFLRVVSSAKQTPALNTSVKFGVNEASIGSSISYNNTTGIFTLLGGGIYEFKGGLGTCYSGASGGWIASTWQKSTDGTNWIPIGMARIDLCNSNPWAHVPNINDAGGTLEFAQTTYLRYVPTVINSVSQIGDNSVLSQVGSNQYCWAEIREVSISCNFDVKLNYDTIPLNKIETINDSLSSGYFDIGNMRIQWGSVTNGVGGSQSITLPVPFANNTYSIVPVIIGGSTNAIINISVTTRSTTAFSVMKTYINAAMTPQTAGEGFTWTAIGLKP